MTTKTVALVTGGNRGLGLEIARQLAELGMQVVIGSRELPKGEAAAESLRAQGLEVRAVKLDVGSSEDIAALPAFFRTTFGRLDVLVNNAGIAIWDQDDLDTFRRTFEVNVFGVVALTYALLPLLQESPAGRIVNQSSILGSLTSLEQAPERYRSFLQPAYTASKAALNGFTVALAHKLADTSIKVNSAHPGWVRTELGGPKAPMNVETGARTAVMLATLPPEGPTGQFFHLGERLPW